MGVKDLSQKLRASDETPDEFSESNLLHGKRIGIYFLVVIHKGLGIDDGAGRVLCKATRPTRQSHQLMQLLL